jgi:hypothetical protein
MQNGLVTDVAAIFSPENTYTFGLNLVDGTIDGDKETRQSEPGTEAVYQLGPGYSLIGSVLLQDNSVILFITNDIDSIIGILKDDVYTEILNEPCFNFKKQYPIKAEYRIINGCERVIYFVDGNNTDKTINIDSLSQYYVANVFNCELTEINLTYSIPDINYLRTDPVGGVNVEVGTYQLALAYEDLSGNRTNYFSITNPISIGFTDISGGQNINAGFAEENGGVPSTSKSIVYTISNMDIKYDKLCVVALVSTNGDQVTNAYLVDKLPVSSNTITYVFTGIGNSTQLDIGEIITNTVTYDRSKIIHISNNRLLRANLKSPDRDWALFQQEANQIQLKWILTETRERENTPSYCFDEVYAFGIKWIFKDGTESPVFHIPGRAKNKYSSGATIALTTDNIQHPRLDPNPGEGWDSSVYNNMDSQFLGGAAERWQIYNTGIKDDTPISGTIASGEMGYYEVSAGYPNKEDCNEDRVYPAGNIRHHRMPDIAMTPFYTNNFPTTPFYRLGVVADNIVIPNGYQNDISGYKIVRAKRDSYNRTVLDTGILYGTHRYVATTDPSTKPDFYFQRSRYNGIWWNYNNTQSSITDNNCTAFLSGSTAWIPKGGDAGDAIGWGSAGNAHDPTEITRHDYLVFHGVKSKFDPAYLGATHIKIEGKAKGVSQDHLCYIKNQAEYGKNAHEVHAESLTYTDYEHPKLSGPNTVKEEGFTNCSVGFQRNIASKGKIILDNAKPFINYSSSECYVVKPTCTSQQLTKLELSTPGNTNQHSCWYISLKKYNPEVHSNLDMIEYIDTSANLNDPSDQIYGGDVYCSLLSTRLTMDAIRRDTVFLNFRNKAYGYLRNLVTYPVYSEINTFLRHGGEGVNCNKVYPQSFSDDTDFLFMEKYIVTDFDKWQKEPVMLCTNYYGYNKDYSKENDTKAFYSIASNWDYCLKCSGQYPNRIVWSETAFEEGFGQDNFRVYKANNYLDVSSTTGELNDLSSYNNNIFAFTDKTVFQLLSGSKELQTNEGTVYIGTGQFLAQPPLEGMIVPHGHAGCSSRFSVKKTEFGVFYIDHLGGKIFKIADGMEPISSLGNEMFFRKNLNNNYLINYLRSIGIQNYNYDDALTHYGGVGTAVTYDSKLKRVVFQSRDFKPLITIKLSTDTPTTDDYFIDVVTHKIYRKDLLSQEEVYLYDNDLFENKSFTISFNCTKNNWLSFHSWSWGHSFTTDKHLYVSPTTPTTNLSVNIEKFVDKGPTLRYYDVPAPMIIEYVEKSLPTDTLESLYYVTKVTDSNFEDKRDLEETFNGLVVYNSHQATPFLNLTIKPTQYSNFRWDNTTKYVTRKDSVWKVSGIRNMVNDTSLPHMSSEWADINFEYFFPFHGYLDKVPNPLVIDTTKSQYTQEMMRDNYNKVRYFYYGTNKLEIDLTFANKLKSIR